VRVGKKEAGGGDEGEIEGEIEVGSRLSHFVAKEGNNEKKASVTAAPFVPFLPCPQNRIHYQAENVTLGSPPKKGNFFPGQIAPHKCFVHAGSKHGFSLGGRIKFIL